MLCEYQNICGGCPLRYLDENAYRKQKEEHFLKIMQNINQENINIAPAVFIADGLRRRAELTFTYSCGKIKLGFNANQSHELTDIEKCQALCDKINFILLNLRRFLEDFCAVNQTVKIKNKIKTLSVKSGKIWLTVAENGIDLLLEIDISANLQHRLLISEFISANPSVIRFSISHKNNIPETIMETSAPYINICGHHVFIAAGTFLQASDAGQKALTDLVIKYVGSSFGNIADLFCGIGTFSYPLSDNIKNKITAVDSSAELLSGFQKTVNSLTIPNIKIINKNLFKYPLDAEELKHFDIIVFDPPRAGAAAQVKKIAGASPENKPQKIIAISCNPHTFVNDANTLLSGGYHIEEITMVDQFVFSNHIELVALFEKN